MATLNQNTKTANQKTLNQKNNKAKVKDMPDGGKNE